MPDVGPNPIQFWLLTGDTPSGPFTIAHIHNELATGGATWQTKACPIGQTVWRSLLATEGIGPTVANRTGRASPQQRSEPRHRTPRQDQALGKEKARATAIRHPLPMRQIGTIFFGVLLLLGVVAFCNSRSGKGSGAMGPILAPATTRDPKLPLLGSWRRESDGVSSTFTFNGDETFNYSTTGCEAFGRWSIRDGELSIEYTGAKEPVNDAQLRGWTGRSPIRFDGAGALLLSGVEGDDVIRTYSRIR